MTIKVVHCKLVDCDVYIGRPSKWGNPYSHKDGTKALYKTNTVQEAVDKYKEYVLSNSELMKQLYELKDKVLGCWCKTKKNPNAPCHGDVLKELVEE